MGAAGSRQLLCLELLAGLLVRPSDDIDMTSKSTVSVEPEPDGGYLFGEEVGPTVQIHAQKPVPAKPPHIVIMQLLNQETGSRQWRIVAALVREKRPLLGGQTGLGTVL